ncbi:MAG: hypothetical protein LBS36_02115 [Oscillospiraceae bacterium]|jgi:hypothetical protein|nr:hypothetical protein [Oscillospiraceae bacterium]
MPAEQGKTLPLSTFEVFFALFRCKVFGVKNEAKASFLQTPFTNGVCSLNIILDFLYKNNPFG